MFRLVTVFALVSYTFAGTLTNDFVGRIVNGTNTTIQRHPYQVSLQHKNIVHLCGGSIINYDTIVTAAHCVVDLPFWDYKIRLGSTKYSKGGELVEIRAVRSHEQYNEVTKVNDIGIIKLSRYVRESDKVRYVELATKSPKTGSPAVVTGWGHKCFEGCDKFSINLQKAEVDILGARECASSKFKYGSRIHPSMICAYAIHKDACQGDSGGPLVAESKLVGVVSWGDGCAEEGFPGVYTEVAYFRKWILATANSL